MTQAYHKLSTTEKVGYGFGDLASNLFWQMFSIFIAKFYTDVFLLGAAAMGTMFLVTRMFDSITDPLMGTLADRTNTRWGKFRPYLLFGAIPMAATAVLTFTTPALDGPAKVAYAYITLSLMMLAYTVINIPYSALLGVLTADSDERTSASSYRFVMALLPVFIIVNATIPMVEWFGGGDPNSQRGWQMTMVVYSVLAIVLFWITFAMTKERVQPPPEQTTSLREDLRNLLRNIPWVVLCVVGIAALTYSNIRGTVAIYYFENVVPDGKGWFGPVMTTGALAFIAGVMLTSPLAKRYGKRNFYVFSMILTAITTAAFYFVPPDNLVAVWFMHALISLVAAPTAPLVWAMYADTADYAEWKWNRRSTGLVFSAASFAQKLGWALGGAGTGWLLAYFGYQAGSAQSAETIHGIVMMMSLIPTVGAIIAIIALFFYPLDEGTVRTMGSDLELRRSRESGTAPDLAVVALGQQDAQPAFAQGQLPATPADTVAFNALHGQRGTSITGLRANAASVAFSSGAPGERAAASAPQQPAFAPGGAHAGEVATGVRGAEARPQLAVLSPREHAALVDEFRSVFEAGIHGLCFSPYVEGQGPGTEVGEHQIRERLAVVRPHTRWVRSFSCTEGHQHTPRIAHEMGLKTLVGAWLGTDREINRREVDGLIEVARAGHVDIAAVGNEVLLRGDLSEDELLAEIARVREALPGVPVGYVDAYFLFEKHPRVTAACDVVLTNCYPFWEGCPREQAVAYMRTMFARTLAAAPGKRVVISETGWPDQGSPFHASVPSPDGTMRYFVDTMRWAEAEGIEVFWFSSFDEAWKVGAEGDVGAYWGLWDKDARPKFG